jgi:hypothetical protein
VNAWRGIAETATGLSSTPHTSRAVLRAGTVRRRQGEKMSKQIIERLARVGAVIVATSACAAVPASAATARSSIIRPCYQTGPQISETVQAVLNGHRYYVKGSCFTAGAPVYLRYVATLSDGAPYWSAKEYTTADSNGDILVQLLAPRITGSDHIQAFNDDNAEEPSNTISVPLPLGTI